MDKRMKKLLKKSSWDKHLRHIIKSCRSDETDESLYFKSYAVKNLDMEITNSRRKSHTSKRLADSSKFKAKIARQKGKARKSKTKILLESKIKNFNNYIDTVDFDEMNNILTKKDEEHIQGFIKCYNSFDLLQTMFEIVNFIKQKFPFLTKCTISLLHLEVQGDDCGERYNAILQGVLQELTELSRSLPKAFIEMYKDYILWLHEKIRQK